MGTPAGEVSKDVVMLPSSPRMDCRPVGFTGGDTKLMVETRPDTQKPGHTGFAVRVSAPGYGIHEVCKDGPTVKVALRVANAKGETVHQDTVEMSKLAFG